MKWIISIVLVIAVVVTGLYVWQYSRTVPAGFKASLLAWKDSWVSSRAWDAVYNEADPATYRERLAEWDAVPETPRHLMRQRIGAMEHFAHGQGDYLVLEEATTGPSIDLLYPFPLDRKFEPSTDLDTRSEFGPLLDCQAQASMVEPATSYDFATWTETGSPPAALLARAEAGDLDAQYDLGLGATYLEDETLAAELAPWLDRAADAGHVEAMTVRGAELISQNAPWGPTDEQGLSYLEAAIEEGSVIAMSLAAYAAPREGEDLNAYAQKRLNWEMQAAAECEPDAMFRIGWRLSTGRGLPRDRDLGVDIAVVSNYGPQIFGEIEDLRLTQP